MGEQPAGSQPPADSENASERASHGGASHSRSGSDGGRPPVWVPKVQPPIRRANADVEFESGGKPEADASRGASTAAAAPAAVGAAAAAAPTPAETPVITPSAFSQLSPADQAFYGWRRFVWLAIFAATIIASAIITGSWAVRYPWAQTWDDAEYQNECMVDTLVYQSNGIGGVTSTILHLDPNRPPGYRLLVFPFTVWLGTSVSTLRAVSYGWFALTLLLVFLAGRKAGGTAAGLVAAMLLGSMPSIVIETIGWFGTEYALFLGTAGMLYFLVRDLHRPKGSWLTAGGLALSIGVGAWSKMSFAMVAPPILLTALVLSALKRLGGLDPLRLISGMFVGTLLGLPFYLHNFPQVLAWAQMAMVAGAGRADISEHGAGFIVTWFKKMFVEAMGWPVTVVLFSLLAGSIMAYLARRRFKFGKGTAVCLLWIIGSMALMLTQLLTAITQHYKHIAPAYFSFTLLCAVAAGRMGLLRRAPVMAGIALLMLAQMTVAMMPRSYQFEDHWDFDKLYDMCAARDLKNPLIAYLGFNGPCTPPAIQHPWLEHEGRIIQRPAELWRAGGKPIDWNYMMQAAQVADVIFTMPGFKGTHGPMFDLDNQHNTEFNDMMKNHPRFSGPYLIPVGQNEPTTIYVYIRH